MVPLWAGLARRGWDSERVRRLWSRLWGDATTRAIASSWFAAKVVMAGDDNVYIYIYIYMVPVAKCYDIIINYIILHIS